MEPTFDINLFDINLSELEQVTGVRTVYAIQDKIIVSLNICPDNTRNAFYFAEKVERMDGRNLTEKQELAAQKLLLELRIRTREALVDAGWRQCFVSSLGTEYWIKQLQITPIPQESKPVTITQETVTDNDIHETKVITRCVKTRSISFICKRCHEQISREQYPAQKPKYCKPCASIVEKEHAKERVRRMRARHKAERHGSQ